MKKTIINLFCSAIAVFTCGSCSSLLDEYNPSGITSETVYNTPEGFETLVNAAYSYQRWWYGKEEGFSMAEMGTDLWMSGAGDAHPALTRYVNLQGNNPAILAEWKALYAAVNVCNAGIGRIDDAGFEEDMKNMRLAELRFLRAFYNWHIVETWGAVHLSTEETSGIITEAIKTPVENFYSLIEEDLLYAVANLPNTTANYGRVTAPAARAFLSRVYLARGNDRAASNYATSVINGSFGFALVSNYASLWSMANQKNTEVVYAVNYSSDFALNDKSDPILNPLGHNRGSNSGHLLYIMKYDTETGMRRDLVNGRPFNRYMPTRFLLDLYSDADSRYEGSFKEVFYVNNPSGSLVAGDTAVFATRRTVPAQGRPYKVYDRNYIYNANGTVRDQLRYPTLTKYLDNTRNSADEAQSSRDVFVIRLAEVYLNAAEAQLKLGNVDSAAYFVNIVRTRAAKTGRAAEMQVTPAQMTLDFILDERAREFAGEQIRWFDLKRTNTLLSRISRYNPDVAPIVKDFHLLRPIPQEQLDAISNKDQFVQNPGYQ
ncbi:RagB/SusD family nutrient uptake outer membrane protein [Sphingobacterium deserti]|uniref:RagB/SusD domain-containing protein n=1 Tax=Sphingobacterium deserti TaxID=1229276 RepID=A0A0B8TB24_9SPHI|nr:RagB/SusD family nutrient uptake outer membrane protein [Sphingobacterium deserti]KGE16064.1 RagB/SusD domain-containing protein [Sphingobacterium deserti]